jgi:hypothetical protein
VTVANLLERAKNAGVVLVVDGDNLRCRGPEEAINALVPDLKVHKPEVLAALKTKPEISRTFNWSPLAPDAIREALDERVGILMANGMPEDMAVQEARWQLERAACWDRFLGHAGIILEAPREREPALLAQYLRDAELVFGQKMAEHMAMTMRSWAARRFQ